LSIAISLQAGFRYLAWRTLGKTLKSQRTLARELGVLQATISDVARRDGEYKQVCPTRRAK
jgi:chorismate-pyruvate lyase